MKTLYLIRHAKSDWSNSQLCDFERSLNNRGKNDVNLIGRELRKINFAPEIIISSPAVRAKLTAEIISKSCHLKNIQFENNIYNASLEDMIDMINRLPQNKNRVALIGHNPTMSLLSNYLTNTFDYQFPTCSVLKLSLEIENWKQIISGIALQEFYIYPKMFQ